MGFFFGFNQCQANKSIMRLLPLLRRALERLAALPVRQPAALEQVLARCQDLTLRLDGVERPVRRPKDPEKQRACYSGRKKRHTVKNLVLEQGDVEFLSPTVPGSQHDKTLAEPLEAVRFSRPTRGAHRYRFSGLSAAKQGVKSIRRKSLAVGNSRLCPNGSTGSSPACEWELSTPSGASSAGGSSAMSFGISKRVWTIW